MNLDEKIISEVDFNYIIEIKNYDKNFPVKCELYDCNIDTEILGGKTQSIEYSIDKNVEFKKDYKLVIKWESNDCMSNKDDIYINVIVTQKNRSD